jgi:hypothetical protein
MLGVQRASMMCDVDTCCVHPGQCLLAGHRQQPMTTCSMQRRYTAYPMEPDNVWMPQEAAQGCRAAEAKQQQQR